MTKPEDYYDLGGKTLEQWDAEHEWWELPPPSALAIERDRQRKEAAQAERLEYSRRDAVRKKARAHMSELIRRDGKQCKRCGTIERLTIDHIIPLARGGNNDLNNLQLLCVRCNSAKGARP